MGPPAPLGAAIWLVRCRANGVGKSRVKVAIVSNWRFTRKKKTWWKENRTQQKRKYQHQQQQYNQILKKKSGAVSREERGEN